MTDTRPSPTPPARKPPRIRSLELGPELVLYDPADTARWLVADEAVSLANVR